MHNELSGRFPVACFARNADKPFHRLRFHIRSVRKNGIREKEVTNRLKLFGQSQGCLDMIAPLPSDGYGPHDFEVRIARSDVLLQGNQPPVGSPSRSVIHQHFTKMNNIGLIIIQRFEYRFLIVEERYQGTRFADGAHCSNGLVEFCLAPAVGRRNHTADMIDPGLSGSLGFLRCLDFIDLGNQRFSFSAQKHSLIEWYPSSVAPAPLATLRKATIRLTFGAVSNIFSLISQTTRNDMQQPLAPCKSAIFRGGYGPYY